MQVIKEENGIIYVDNLPGRAPIGGYLETKELIISLEDWNSYTDNEKLSLFDHEQAHFINNSVDEFAADLVGFLIYAQRNTGDIDAAFTWMEKLFTEDNEEQMRRLEIQKKRVFYYKTEGKVFVSSGGTTSDLMQGGYLQNVSVTGQEAALIAQVVPAVPGIIDSASGFLNTYLQGVNNFFFGRKNQKAAEKQQSNQLIYQYYANRINQKNETKRKEFTSAANAGIASNVAFAVVALAIVFAIIYVLRPKK